MKYVFTRQELKGKAADDFMEGDVIKTGKYYIFVKYGIYNHASLCTQVEPEYSMIPLPMRKHPQYIRSFIEERRENRTKGKLNAI